MKDIEKIKSEDLGCQVQDANPGNFAIEQEVGAMVGATVPAPTAPSADDALELGAQLLVFLRRALLPIKSALRTALADIYAHLDSRCTDYTPAAYASYQDPSTVPPYDPMRPLTPRTLPNLLTAITAFSARKISGVPEAADGISLVHLLANNSNITELTDSTSGWTYNGLLSRTVSLFSALTKVTMGCDEIDYNNDNGWTYGCSGLTDLLLPTLKFMFNRSGAYAVKGFAGLSVERLSLPVFEEYKTTSYCQFVADNSNLKYLDIPTFKKLTHAYSSYLVKNCPELLEVYAPHYQAYDSTWYGGGIADCPKVQKVTIGNSDLFLVSGCVDLIHFELGEEQTKSLNISSWNPTNVLSDADKTATFLQNFREHIALRLTANGSGKTLTLSQAVRDAIHAAEATYGIEAIIVTQKGWTLSPAPTA